MYILAGHALPGIKRGSCKGNDKSRGPRVGVGDDDPAQNEEGSHEGNNKSRDPMVDAGDDDPPLNGVMGVVKHEEMVETGKNDWVDSAEDTAVGCER